MNNYEFIEFRKSTNPNKKYDAFLRRKKQVKLKSFALVHHLINNILIQQV